MEGECGLSVDLTLDVKGHIARDLGGIDPEVAGERDQVAAVQGDEVHLAEGLPSVLSPHP